VHPVSRWSLLVLLNVAGCSEPATDLFSVEGIVRGTIRQAADDAPVTDAWIALDASYPLGNGNPVPIYDSVRTDGGGRYVGRLELLNLPDTVVALTVRVWPRATSRLAPASRADLELRVTADLPPRDTLVVDFTLQP